MDRRNFMQELVPSTGSAVQRMSDDGPVRKRRKLSELLDVPKVCRVSERLALSSPSETRASNLEQSSSQPSLSLRSSSSSHVAHSSHHSLRTRRIRHTLQRHNSSPPGNAGVQFTAANNDRRPSLARSRQHEFTTVPLDPQVHLSRGGTSTSSLRSLAGDTSRDDFAPRVSYRTVVPPATPYTPLTLPLPLTATDLACQFPPSVTYTPPAALANMSSRYLTPVNAAQSVPSAYSGVSRVPAAVLAADVRPAYYNMQPVAYLPLQSAALAQPLPTSLPPGQRTSVQLQRSSSMDATLQRHMRHDDRGHVTVRHRHQPNERLTSPSTSSIAGHTDNVPESWGVHSNNGVWLMNPAEQLPYQHGGRHRQRQAQHQQPLFVHQFLSMLESSLVGPQQVVYNPLPHFHNYEALLGLARQLSESKPKGMSKSDIDRLPSYQYTNIGARCLDDDDGGATAQTSCVVCMCDFTTRQRIRELPCQHIFHMKCIDKWLKTNKSCPLCRCDVLHLLNSDTKPFITRT